MMLHAELAGILCNLKGERQRDRLERVFNINASIIFLIGVNCYIDMSNDRINLSWANGSFFFHG